jgi:hypothetical protein
LEQPEGIATKNVTIKDVDRKDDINDVDTLHEKSSNLNGPREASAGNGKPGDDHEDFRVEKREDSAPVNSVRLSEPNFNGEVRDLERPEEVYNIYDEFLTFEELLDGMQNPNSPD